MQIINCTEQGHLVPYEYLYACKAISKPSIDLMH